jgi:flagellar assembly protein FliH
MQGARMNASRFLFGEDFRGPQTEDKDAAAIARAEARGFERGREAGRQDAVAEAARGLDQALASIGAGLGGILAELDARDARTERESMQFFKALAEKLAGQALEAYPLATIAESAEEAFRHLRGVPHLAVRVSETLVEQVDALTRKMARERGYEGRIIILGDEAILPGDARIEWADGGIVRERKDIEAALGAVLAGTL